MLDDVRTRVEAFDVRFPTARAHDGSDAMNPDPDYSAAYVMLRTDAADGLEGQQGGGALGELGTSARQVKLLGGAIRCTIPHRAAHQNADSASASWQSTTISQIRLVTGLPGQRAPARRGRCR